MLTRMHIFSLLLLSGFFHLCSCSRILSRQKRYLTFPEGSSLSVAICMTAQTGIMPTGLFTEGVNWALSFELPNDTSTFKDFYSPVHKIKRRNRRELYGKIETLLQSMGYDGRSCILRTLCEVSRQFTGHSESFLDEILRIVFGFPKEHIHPSEPEETLAYQSASEQNPASLTKQCYQLYNCPFSLIDFILGYHSGDVF